MAQKSSNEEAMKQDDRAYHTTRMQRELVIQKLREQGCRITKQRLVLLDIILEEDCSCCKEIYYKASRRDDRIGFATVYRMVNTLEQIGAISRKNMYRIACRDAASGGEKACCVELDDHTVCSLSPEMFDSVMLAGLKACGYIKDQKIEHVTVMPCGGE